MQYSEFKRLIAQGEKANVDFKIRCNAFLSKDVASKVELAKDIRAMANNGNIASYIIVGVSDGGQSFESVGNTNLTDNKIQKFPLSNQLVGCLLHLCNVIASQYVGIR